ncbi:MAG: TIGR01777 family protein [Dehalococcoidia bacterium]|nr:TIGR01777 family protein [Dehalococcoidia bacterium]
MRVVVSGSSGLVGTAVREQLAAEGHEVQPLLRGDAEGSGPRWIAPSGGEAGWIAPNALAGADAVVHLAGASIGEGRWTERRRTELRASRIDATRLLVDHLGTLAERPRVLVAASAVGAYGDRGDELLTEDAALGSGFLADLVRDWEREVVRAEALGVRVVRLRFGVVLAAHGGALPRMVTPMKLGVGGRLGSGRQWMPWVALPDVARAISWALAEPVHGVVNVVAPEQATNAEFTRALGRVLHRPALFPTPALALRLLLGGAADELLLASQRVVPARLLAAGFQFTQPRVDGALRAIFAPRPATGERHAA